MANLPSDKRNIRKLTKVGGKSYAITLPIEIVRELGWREHQKLVIEKKGAQLVVKDWD